MTSTNTRTVVLLGEIRKKRGSGRARVEGGIRKLAAPFIAIALSPALTLAAVAQQASFQGLGQMPGGCRDAGTYASAISADGSTIMGYGWLSPTGGSRCSYSDTVKAYRWTFSGYQVLGASGNSSYFGAGAVSKDGSVIVGEHPQQTGPAAFRWTLAHGMKQLPINIAAAVTSDGAMVAGGDNWWTRSGQTGIFGPFPGQQDQTQAYGLSGPASAPVAVGGAIEGSDQNGPTFHAFRWTPAGGLHDLGVTTGTQSFATAISEDGSVIVGQATDGSGFWRAFRWTSSTGMVDIGTLGGPESAPTGVNRDGTVIVGTSLTSGGSASNHVFRWTAKAGMQDVLTLLQAAGVNGADTWVSLFTMVGVSADGTVMAGYGQGPRTKAAPFGDWTPFRVVLPLP